jgi:putative redox protein
MSEQRPDAQREETTPPGLVIVRETRHSKFDQEIIAGTHHLLADEPVSAGGQDNGPGPYDLLLASLGACTSMTIRLYADHKKIPLQRVEVRLRHFRVYASDCEECETKEGMVDHIDREIRLDGDLTTEQRAKLMDIANRCPVHRTLTSEINIRTVALQ